MEALHEKAMEGSLREGELDKLRHHAQSAAAAMKSFLSKLRLLRTRGSALASMPPDVISYLDAAIGILKSHNPNAGA